MPALSRLFLFSSLSILSLQAQWLVNTVAGGKIRSSVPASDVLIRTIGGITLDAAGNIVFAESSRHVIRRITPSGVIETIAGTGVSGFAGDGGPALAARLNAPTSLQYDPAGNLYFVDSVNCRIRRIDTAGNIKSVAGTGICATELANAAEVSEHVAAEYLAIDKDGIVYFSERRNNRIRRLTASGRLELVVGRGYPCGQTVESSAADVLCFSPGPLAFDEAGNLYFVNLFLTNSGMTILRLTPDGIVEKFAGYGPDVAGHGEGGPALDAHLEAISGMSVDSSGVIYLAVSHLYAIDSRVQRIDSDRILSTVAGGGRGGDGPALQAEIRSISGVVADGSGNVYFIDNNLFSNTSKVRQLTPQGSIQTIAGGSPKGAPDGTPVDESWLVDPGSIAFGRNGDLYILEAVTCTVRKIGSNGRLATVAGSGKCSGAGTSGPASSIAVPADGSIAVDSQGRVYISAFTGGVIAVSPDGMAAPVPGIPNVYAISISVDSKDRLYIVGNVVLRIPPGGTWEPVIGATGIIQRPVGVAVDASDNIYIADRREFRLLPLIYVSRFDQRGVGGVVGITFASQKVSLAAEPSGRAWLTGVDNHLNELMVPISRPLDQILGFSGDGGPAGAAAYNNPSGVAVGPNGDLYVIDRGNDRIRKIGGKPPKNAPAISQGGIVNAASLAGGAIARGEFVSIFGSNFGPSSLQVNAAENNILPKVLSGTRVFFGLAPAVITAATENQINAFVPHFGIDGEVIVEVDGVRSASVTVPISTAAIGLFSTDGSGAGQGAILNQDGSYNSRTNPAARGSIVSLFGTGEGAASPTLPDGALVVSTPLPKPDTTPITVTIGGAPAEILYAGAAPMLPNGILQLNVRIPAGAAQGDLPVSVTVGSSSTVKQITCAVK